VAWGPAWTDTGYVFVREDGLPYFPEHFSTAWERHIKRLDLRPIRLHDARHTAATLALGAGEKIEVVSKWLGHANVAITQQIYAHVLPSMLERHGRAAHAADLRQAQFR
jgi:integrase